MTVTHKYFGPEKAFMPELATTPVGDLRADVGRAFDRVEEDTSGLDDLVQAGEDGEVFVGKANTNYVALRTNDGSEKLRAENDGAVRVMKNNKPLQGTTAGGLPQDMIKLGPNGEILIGGGNANFIGFRVENGDIKVSVENDGTLKLRVNNKGLAGQHTNPLVTVNLAKIDDDNNVVLGDINAHRVRVAVGGVSGFPVVVENGGKVLMAADGKPVQTAVAGALDITNESYCGVGVASWNSADVWGPFHYGIRYRGTKAAPTAVQLNDVLMEYGCYGHDGNGGAFGGGELMFIVDGPVATGKVPARAELHVWDADNNDICALQAKHDGKMKFHLPGIPVYADNAAALAGGLVAGQIYRTGADPDALCIVH